jgi:hypothetical protein
MKSPGGQKSTHFKTMQNKGQIRRAGPEPPREKLDVLIPVGKGHLVEDAFAFAYAAIIVTKNLYAPLGQISGPPNPRIIRMVPLGSKRPHQENPRDRIGRAVKYGIKMSPGDLEIARLLMQFIIERILGLHSPFRSLRNQPIDVCLAY